MLSTFLFASATPSSVKVAPMDNVGPRPMEQQTQTSVIRDYLQAWQGLGSALEQNRADLLERDFAGQAKETLAHTIREQQKLGIRTSYEDRAHNIKVLFYSPEGLSIQLVDDAEYEVQVHDHHGILGTQQVHTRYFAVLTPTESRWKVRIFQGSAP
ncbi:MAG: hypothetical protein WBS24_04745 [Terriglobales bacterium]